MRFAPNRAAAAHCGARRFSSRALRQTDHPHKRMSSQRLQGVFTPNIVPLDAAGEIHEAELRRYTEWLIVRGVHGLYPNGSTGEFTRFTPDERRRIIAIMAEQARGRVPILAGAAEANVRETLEACEYYHGLGVRSVAIVAPYYFRLSPDNVYAYFKEIGDRTPIDVTLYNIPMFASPLDVATVARLSQECPRIVAIKDSSGDLPHMMRMIAAVRPQRPDFSFLTGWDASLAPMMLIGCDGGTHAMSGIFPELMRKIYELAAVGDFAAAMALQYKLLPIFDAIMGAADFPEGVRISRAAARHRRRAGASPSAHSSSARLETLRNTATTVAGRRPIDLPLSSHQPRKRTAAREEPQASSLMACSTE